MFDWMKWNLFWQVAMSVQNKIQHFFIMRDWCDSDTKWLIHVSVGLIEPDLYLPKADQQSVESVIQLTVT
jgi:hypothetical protein